MIGLTTRILLKWGAFNGFFAELRNNYFTFGDYIFFTFVPFNYALYNKLGDIIEAFVNL